MQQQLNIREVKDYDNRTLLHLAASEGAVAAAEWLIASGVDISAVDRFGRTPLMEALVHNHSPVAQILLQVRFGWMFLTLFWLHWCMRPERQRLKTLFLVSRC